jgi:hypothetical protein
MGDMIASSMQSSGGSDVGINTPDINKEGKPQRYAFKDAAQAFSICTSLEVANRETDKVNSEIGSRYNGAAPFKRAKLKAAGQSHRYNIHTGYLCSIIDRKVLDFPSVIENARSLTNASLPRNHPDGAKKADIYRAALTRVVRSWPEWRDFLQRCAAEDVLYGYGCAACTDRFDWRPEVFVQGQFYVPDGTLQYSKKCQCIAFRKPFLLAEAVEKILNIEDASLAGWNVENMVKAINNASPDRPQTTGNFANTRAWEDAVREQTICSSYTNGAKIVNTWDFYAQEIDGTVSQAMVEAKSGDELFMQRNRYQSMEDVCQFFSLQVGNGKLKGSKGLGRLLVNLAIAAEKSRNLFFDTVAMSQNLIFKCTPAELAKLQQTGIPLTISNPFAIIGIEGELLQVQVQANPELFMSLNNVLNGFGEVLAGTVLPGNVYGDDSSDETATKTTVDAQRENQVRAGVLARWAFQVSKIISMMQRRLGDPETIDEVAKEFQADLLQAGLTPEEIVLLSNSPAARDLSDIAAIQAQQIAAVSMKYGNSPFIDQKKLVKRDVEQMTSPELADELLLDDQETAVITVEQSRLQLMELGTMIDGVPEIPVSPRDDDAVHMDTIEENWLKIAPVLQSAPEPQLIKATRASINHYSQHIEAAKMKGMDPQMLGQRMAMLKDADSSLKALEKQLSETNNPNLPTPVPGVPPNAVPLMQ